MMKYTLNQIKGGVSLSRDGRVTVSLSVFKENILLYRQRSGYCLQVNITSHSNDVKKKVSDSLAFLVVRMTSYV